MFQKATKEKLRARILYEGVTGAGKTHSGLKAAKFFAGDKRVALIDTEYGRADAYSDIFDFDSVKLSSFAPRDYIRAIRAAEQGNYGAIVIDSLTHAWQGKDGVLDIAGGVFQGWKKATPEHRALIEAILQSPLHVVATVRSKMGYQMVGNKVERVGLEAIQRDDLEFEFHIAAAFEPKTNSMELLKVPGAVGKVGQIITVAQQDEFLQKFAGWLNTGVEPAPKAIPQETEESTPTQPRAGYLKPGAR